jgi:hypothetical protein
MGEVKDAVKGSGPKVKKKHIAEGSLTDQVRSLADEISRLITIKDEDTLNEGDAEKPENIRKAGILRAANSLLRSAGTILEDY